MVSRYGGRSEAAVLSMMVGLVAARSTAKGVAAVARIQSQMPESLSRDKVRFLPLDLASLASV